MDFNVLSTAQGYLRTKGWGGGWGGGLLCRKRVAVTVFFLPLRSVACAKHTKLKQVVTEATDRQD